MGEALRCHMSLSDARGLRPRNPWKLQAKEPQCWSQVETLLFTCQTSLVLGSEESPSPWHWLMYCLSRRRASQQPGWHTLEPQEKALQGALSWRSSRQCRKPTAQKGAQSPPCPHAITGEKWDRLDSRLGARSAKEHFAKVISKGAPANQGAFPCVCIPYITHVHKTDFPSFSATNCRKPTSTTYTLRQCQFG